jgi:K+ transporter
VPLVNGCLLVLCVAVVAGFRDTVALGKAYGLAGGAGGPAA